VVYILRTSNVIVCSCRSISDHDFKTKEELIRRIMQSDYKCGICQIGILKSEQTTTNNLTNLVDE